MTDETVRRGAPRRRSSRVEYWTYYAVIYVVALPVACLKWLGEPPIPQIRSRRSPFGEARRMTENVLPYVFMA